MNGQLIEKISCLFLKNFGVEKEEIFRKYRIYIIGYYYQ
jgi:hypothetical protein